MICLPGLVISLLLIAAGQRCPPIDARPLPPPETFYSAQTEAGVDPLSAALAAEREGRDPEAESGYRKLLNSSNLLLSGEANLALGRFLERRNRSAAAEAPLSVAKSDLGDSPEGLAATFLLGEAETDQKDYGNAARSFTVYVQAGGSAQGYGRLEAAWALQSAGDDHGALAMLLIPLESQSPAIRQAALGAASDSLAHLGESGAAAADQEALAADARSPSDRAAALLAAGRLYHQAGNDVWAAALLSQLIQQYPGFGTAGSAIDLLDSIGAKIDSLQRAAVLYRLRRNDAARSELLTILASQPAMPVAAKATFYIAALDDRADRNDDALAGYRQALQMDPNGDLAAEALWDEAQLLQSLDHYADGQSAYSDFAGRFPSDDRAGEALSNAALMAYLDGRPDEAGGLWNRSAQFSDKTTAARAELWLGKLAAKGGDSTAAARYLAAAQTASPAGYFGLRAATIAAGAAPSILGPAAKAGDDGDWTPVERWIASWAGPERPDDFNGLQRQDAWREGLALNRLGWQATPPTLLEEAIADEKHHPWALYRAARALHDLGLTREAMAAADDLLDLAPGNRLQAPAALLRLDYPLDYAGLINEDAAANGLDPLLISALVRQESAFDPAIGSGAGAQGLTQLLPGTAGDTAKTIGIGDVTTADLKRPSINLKLGSAYLAHEASAENRDLSRTLAAYNAGGGNADRWARTSGSDPDLFYEMVDFDETRSYIRLVSQNYAIYNFLYRGLAKPSLVHP
jgi:soluble lytic murein transglycosylase